MTTHTMFFVVALVTLFVGDTYAKAQDKLDDRSIEAIEKPVGLVDGHNETFGLESIPDDRYPIVTVINGLLNTAHMAPDKNRIIISPAPKPGDQMFISYHMRVGPKAPPPSQLLSNILNGAGELETMQAARALDLEFESLLDKEGGLTTVLPSEKVRSLQMLHRSVPDSNGNQDEGGIDGLGDDQPCRLPNCHSNVMHGDEQDLPLSLKLLNDRTVQLKRTLTKKPKSKKLVLGTNQ